MRKISPHLFARLVVDWLILIGSSHDLDLLLQKPDALTALKFGFVFCRLWTYCIILHFKQFLFAFV